MYYTSNLAGPKAHNIIYVNRNKMSPKLHLSNKETVIEGSILNRSKNELMVTTPLGPYFFYLKKEKIRALQITDLSQMLD